ncbi:unnamed protein product [Trichobilharzia szidati]|nr:unnamed protein product [Trichobilharzia szidati]
MMPGPKKGPGILEADRKVSDVELPVMCDDVYDVQHDKLDVNVSPEVKVLGSKVNEAIVLQSYGYCRSKRWLREQIDKGFVQASNVKQMMSEVADKNRQVVEPVPADIINVFHALKTWHRNDTINRVYRLFEDWDMGVCRMCGAIVPRRDNKVMLRPASYCLRELRMYSVQRLCDLILVDVEEVHDLDSRLKNLEYLEKSLKMNLENGVIRQVVENGLCRPEYMCDFYRGCDSSKEVFVGILDKQHLYRESSYSKALQSNWNKLMHSLNGNIDSTQHRLKAHYLDYFGLTVQEKNDVGSTIRQGIVIVPNITVERYYSSWEMVDGEPVEKDVNNVVVEVTWGYEFDRRIALKGVSLEILSGAGPAEVLAAKLLGSTIIRQRETTWKLVDCIGRVGFLGRSFDVGLVLLSIFKDKVLQDLAQNVVGWTGLLNTNELPCNWVTKFYRRRMKTIVWRISLNDYLDFMNGVGLKKDPYKLSPMHRRVVSVLQQGEKTPKEYESLVLGLWSAENTRCKIKYSYVASGYSTLVLDLCSDTSTVLEYHVLEVGGDREDGDIVIDTEECDTECEFNPALINGQWAKQIVTPGLNYEQLKYNRSMLGMICMASEQRRGMKVGLMTGLDDKVIKDDGDAGLSWGVLVQMNLLEYTDYYANGSSCVKQPDLAKVIDVLDVRSMVSKAITAMSSYVDKWEINLDNKGERGIDLGFSEEAMFVRRRGLLPWVELLFGPSVSLTVSCSWLVIGDCNYRVKEVMKKRLMGINRPELYTSTYGFAVGCNLNDVYHVDDIELYGRRERSMSSMAQYEGINYRLDEQTIVPREGAFRVVVGPMVLIDGAIIMKNYAVVFRGDDLKMGRFRKLEVDKIVGTRILRDNMKYDTWLESISNTEYVLDQKQTCDLDTVELLRSCFIGTEDAVTDKTSAGK